ncbi:SUMF1/EgtB/PvdO family nonheme iron enzyme [Haliangium sp.]|uniref:SUMF1/EgtB/PvdO family nonheme iron enzyme n=1 Tax=Haliangium sp. TaxID=2663208 RepID=UPI003D12BD3D
MTSPERIGPGAVIDERYEVLSHLGTGGFGLVYKARQLNTGQLVAIKIARQVEGPGSESALARFRREMEVVAELSHPNIVRLFDTGQLDDGRLFAVFELIRGVSLDELLRKEGALPPAEAKYLMLQVLDALFSAHDLGVIHRDLKPPNIMVSSAGARRNAMVLDFGIATFMEAARDEDYQSLTPDGFAGGTPAYMAPEQYHGHEPNPQTDVYSWGLLFLECLTGNRVVDGRTAAENMFLHLRNEPHTLPPMLSEHPLGLVLRKAVAKDPAERYVDTREALADLAGVDVSDLHRSDFVSTRSSTAPSIAPAAYADTANLEPEQGPALRWLHISDLHAGAPGAALTHTHFDELETELRYMAARVGPPDLLLVSGDLTFSGHEEEYVQAEAVLELIQQWLSEAHPGTPPALVFAVPGNHDLVRPTGKEKRVYRVLGDYDNVDDSDVRELHGELFDERDVGLVATLFPTYMRWMATSVIAPLESDPRCAGVHTSFFPGDLSAIIERDGLRLGLVGLNSAWIHYGAGDFQGRLHLPPEQFDAALSEDIDLESCDGALLLMHHPPSWLSKRAQSVFLDHIYPISGPPGAPAARPRFSACLYGHAHSARGEIAPASANDGRAYAQAPALYGLGRAGLEWSSRPLGYHWGELRKDGGVRLWPRVLTPAADGHLLFARDQRFDDPASDGAVWLRPPPSKRAGEARSDAGPTVRDRPRPAVRAPVMAAPKRTRLPRDDRPTGFEDALSEYARRLRGAFGFIDMAGLGGGHLRLQLDDVFVPLRLRTREAETDDPRTGRMVRRQKEHDVTLADAFTRAQPASHLFILGEPGAGKTTALRKLLWSTLASTNPVSTSDPARGGDTEVTIHGEFDGTRIGLPGPTVPVFLRLRDLDPEAMNRPMSAFIDGQLALVGDGRGSRGLDGQGDDDGAHAPLPPGFGDWLWQRGYLLLLLDGLDEIADSGQRAEVCRYIENNLAAARTQGIPGLRAVVSSRYAGLHRASGAAEDLAIGFGPGFARLDISPLDDSQVATLIQRWFVAAELSMARLGQSDEEAAATRGEARGTELASQLRSAEYASRRIKELVANPLLLTLLCVQVFDGGQIPRQRVDFFQDCLRTLLRRWTRGFSDDGPEPPLLELGDALRLLRPVAWRLHTSQRKSDLSRSEIKEAMHPALRRLQIDRQVGFDQVLDWLCRHTGVLEEFAPGEYGFLHLSLQEYLAASHAAMHLNEGLATLAAEFGQPWWREVILLFVALGEGRYFEPLISRVLAADDQLESQEAFLRACLDEASAPDVSPLVGIVAAEHERTSRRIAALRLLLHRVDDQVRRAAMRAALQAPRDSELRALAEEVEARRLPVDDLQSMLVPTVGADDDEEHLDVVLVPSGEDELLAWKLRDALTAAGLTPYVARDPAIPMPASEREPDELLAARSRAAAALVGPNGICPWEFLDTRALLHAFIDRGLPVVPVMLPGAGRTPSLPRFLAQYTWVDLRAGVDERGLGRLIWSITGREPTLDTGTHAIAAIPREQFFVEPTTGIRFLWIPGGTFSMGANDLSDAEAPPHRVEVAPFWMGETLVTNRQYEQFLVATGSPDPMYWRERRYNEPDQPVVGVSWQDAKSFCTWLTEVSGYPIDLPSEAQWEFAARSEDDRLFPWGDDDPDHTRAHFAKPGSTPLPVGSLPAGRGPFGTLDQAGNVWEWCRDVWDALAYRRRGKLSLNPLIELSANGEDDVHVVRGGSFLSHPLYLRAAYRDRYRAVLADDLGFRVVALPGGG